MSDIIKDLTTTPPKDTKTVLLFWTSWHEDSSPGGSTSKLFETLAASSPNTELSFYRVEAEENAELSSEYNVTIVPTFVFINANNVIMNKIEGMDESENISKVTNALQSLIQSKVGSTSTDNNTAAATTTIEEEKEDPQQKLNNKLKNLINSSPIMLFMKGTPTQPKCGFSRQAIELLSSSKPHKLIYGTFDILSDDEVRQGLKTYSDWPTFPQLYVNGDLLGGLDIMKEMLEESEGDLVEAFGIDVTPSTVQQSSTATTTTATPANTLEERLKQLITRSKVILFMKGLPSQPKCGFSRQICELLAKENVTFDAFDILSDEEVRQGLKTYSDWPTFPQLYVDGELVGGLDIVKELIESDELKEMIEG
jgi:Grx4 family monothiol glutaredoxin